MHRIAPYIILGLILILTLPVGVVEHALDVLLENTANVSDCGCPSEENSHAHDDTTGDCDTNCNCTCHLTLTAALLHFDDACEVACDPIIEQQPLLALSYAPSQPDRPPRSSLPIS